MGTWTSCAKSFSPFAFVLACVNVDTDTDCVVV